MVGGFQGRDITERAHCPFCGLQVDQPKELQTRMPHEMPVGRCECGAVYAYDATGHNLGMAMIEALVFGCKGDWDLAWSLLPEEDYLERQVDHYDLETHLVIPRGVYEGRRVAGTLYFIRLHRDIREVTDEGAKRWLEQATPVSKGSAVRAGDKKAFTKRQVEALVRDYKVAALTRMAGHDKRIIRDLQRLIYSVDKQLRWRATDLLGKTSAVIAEADPGAISKLLQRLFTAVADTAASSWGCLDAIGEIIGNSPEQFAGYAPQLYQFASDRELLPEVLRALGRIGESKPELIRNKAFYFIPLLSDANAEIRGYAAILLGNLRAHEAREDLERLIEDSERIEVYIHGSVKSQSIGQLASNALEKL